MYKKTQRYKIKKKSFEFHNEDGIASIFKDEKEENEGCEIVVPKTKI